MNEIKLYQTAAAVDKLIEQVAAALRSRLAAVGIDDPVIIGIHTGGAWLAERLHHALGIDAPLGTLDISFYRDDYTRIGMNPQVRPSRIPFSIDNRHIILVDDVLQTGRTIRAAMNEIFDYGRPASIILATLVQRGGRELPIEPDVVGIRPVIEPGEQITLTGPSPLELVVGQSKTAARKRQK